MQEDETSHYFNVKGRIGEELDGVAGCWTTLDYQNSLFSRRAVHQASLFLKGVQSNTALPAGIWFMQKPKNCGRNKNLKQGRKKCWQIPAGVLEIQLVSVPKKMASLICPFEKMGIKSAT